MDFVVAAATGAAAAGEKEENNSNRTVTAMKTTVTRAENQNKPTWTFDNQIQFERTE